MGVSGGISLAGTRAAEDGDGLGTPAGSSWAWLVAPAIAAVKNRFSGIRSQSEEFPYWLSSAVLFRIYSKLAS
jgi:hypothetical protein